MSIKHWWDDTDSRNRSTWRETCTSATLSTTKPTWTCLGLNAGFCSDGPASNHLSHGTASQVVPEPWYILTIGTSAMAQPHKWSLSHGTSSQLVPKPWHSLTSSLSPTKTPLHISGPFHTLGKVAHKRFAPDSTDQRETTACSILQAEKLICTVKVATTSTPGTHGLSDIIMLQILE
jgi:hypothetical protein